MIKAIKYTPSASLDAGISIDKIKEISEIKNEPSWMCDFRLKAYEKFLSTPNPAWGPNLSRLNFDNFLYYIKSTPSVEASWDKVPKKIKDTFSKLGIPEAERLYLSGVSTQFESEVVYHSTKEELDASGVIFLDTDSALKLYPELFMKYFNTIIPFDDNKYSALNSAVWSGGSFIYVPKGVHVEKPLQSYFRLNSKSSGQFERTLIIVDDDASVHYVEGCTAPIYTSDSLHAAVVEIYVGKRATMRYSTIQNWSNNVVNLVTKRAIVQEGGLMEWIDGNIGSGINMKYPSCILAGDGATGFTLSIAIAGAKQYQDSGAKMIHLAPNTKSNVISKSICKNGGHVNYRGLVYIDKKATNSHAFVQCDTLMLDDVSHSDTIPTNTVKNPYSIIEHEATVSKISEDQLFYLMSRGLSKKEATELIVMGFIERFSKELPMEYAVELNHLIKLEMEGSIG
jgi:Fe-S cluster assembly protein SufB